MSQPITESAAASSLDAMNVAGLIDHLLANYHEKHRADLPELIALAEKVERVHHDVPDAPLGLATALQRIAAEVDAHMMKEEHVLFPAMRNAAGSGLAAPIAVMREDHTHHEGDIAELKMITGSFNVPDGACGSWRRLMAGVETFCSELEEHIRIENQILFPRFEIAAKTRCTCAHS